MREGAPPESLLVLCYSTAAADALRARLEDRLAGAYEELAVTTFHGFCARLLRDEALEAGLDPFVTPVSAADRLAMLLERIDDLPLRHHDLRGNPSATLGAIVQRIDRLKDELVSAADYAAWAARCPRTAPREREFAELYGAHERDARGGRHARRRRPRAAAASACCARSRTCARGWPTRHRHVLVDELQDASFAQGLLLRLLAAERQRHGGRRRRPGDPPLPRRRDQEHPGLPRRVAGGDGGAARALVPLARARSSPPPAAVAPGEIEKALDGEPGGEVAFWRCASERAQAQAVAAEVERLIAREDVAPEDVCVLVRSVRGEGQAVAVAFEERAVPYRLSGAAAFFQRAEVRDLLAWLRLLVDPGDAGAVVRALARPPVELRAIDLARVTQIARRRKLDMVAALGAALESPQIPPEARERITHFLRLHRAAAAAIDSTRPDLYVHRLVERLGLRRQLLFAASTEVVERLQNLAKFAELAADYVRRAPQATARDFARSIAAVADAGLREEEAAAGERPHGVRVMSMHAAKGLEFDHVYVLGLMAARMPGPRRRALEPIPDALIKEAVPPDSKATHAAEMRRLLHVAMTRARRRLVLAFPERSERGALQQPSPFAEEARAAVGGEWEEQRRGAVRAGRDAAVDLPDAARRAAHHRRPGRRPARRAALRHRPRRLARRRPLPRAAQARRADGAHARPARPTSATCCRRSTRGCCRRSPPSSARSSRRSALDEYLLDAERDEKLRARAVAQRTEPSLESFLPRRGDGPRAERLRHRDLPDVPAQVQVRARLPDPERADDQPALRDPRPPGARALPRRRVGGPARRC